MTDDTKVLMDTVAIYDVFERADGSLWDVRAIDRLWPSVELAPISEPNGEDMTRERITADDLVTMLARKEIKLVQKRGHSEEEAARDLNLLRDRRWRNMEDV
jgi:hypothetical protein